MSKLKVRKKDFAIYYIVCWFNNFQFYSEKINPTRNISCVAEAGGLYKHIKRAQKHPVQNNKCVDTKWYSVSVSGVRTHITNAVETREVIA